MDDSDNEPTEYGQEIPRVEPSLSTPSLVGSRIGDYQVLRKLGRGGMADVYSARQVALGRESAVKVLREEFARDKDYIARFRREAQAAAKLNHPNIVQVYEVGDATQHFIAQELVDGVNLKQKLVKDGPLNAEEAIEVLACVASALEAASEVGIIHRDIKPENIMRSTKGIIKVADFGLARLTTDGEASRANLTQAGLTLGTPRYMSPEQVQGKMVDVRSDLYSLGVTVYHLLTGRPPFEAEDPLALAVLHLHETPQPLDRARGKDDLPEWLIAVVSKLMSKLPSDRFQSPAELLEAIKSQAALSQRDAFTVGTAAATIRLQRASRHFSDGNRRNVLRSVAATLLVLSGIGAGYWMASRSKTKQVSELLVPETVEASDSIEQQFLIAMTRDDLPGWKAIAEHFPPGENPKNRNYYIKSLLQIARLQSDQERYPDALRTIDQVLSESKLPSKFAAIAWARKCSVLRQIKDERKLADAERMLKSAYRELQEKSPEGLRLFQSVVPPSDRVGLETEETT